ncbi:MAG: metal-dependent transcriptional regulator [Pyramidobacter sp.]|nr:metal-dependent transcriptional regulator [Pyramidobacter sp.]
MNIHESAENYLERILMLQERLGYARSVDIAAELRVTKASVSVAMKRLRENDYITMDSEGLLMLSPKGREIAERVYARHKVLTAFLVGLGVSEEQAAEDACKVEHDLSEESYAALWRFVQGAQLSESE